MSPNLKEMLKSGDLRRRIMMDQQDNDLTLTSIDFDQKYKIQDILSNRGEGKIDFNIQGPPTHKEARATPSKLKSTRTLKNSIAFYKMNSGSTKPPTTAHQSFRSAVSRNSKIAWPNHSVHKKDTAKSNLRYSVIRDSKRATILDFDTVSLSSPTQIQISTPASPQNKAKSSRLHRPQARTQLVSPQPKLSHQFSEPFSDK